MENSVKTPPWMDEEFFNIVIQHHTADANAKVTNYIIKPSLTPGECFASMIYRVEINFSTASQATNTLSVLIKIPPMQGAQAEFVESSPLFVTEQEVYNKPLVDIKNLLESVGDDCNINPKLIYQTTKPHRVIVLEDLGPMGFVKISQPLEDFDATKMVFERLAKYHAASYFLINEKKADYSSYKTSIFHIEDPIIREKFLFESVEAFTEVLADWGGYDDYVDRLKTYRENLIDLGKRLYEPDVNGYNVLNHGDFHVKNLLFQKSDDDKIREFFMMDFQVCVFASPCVDLFYALYNMISDENRRARRDEIIHFYHSEFTKALKRFGYIGKIPSLLDLQMALMQHGHMEVLKCIFFKIFFWIDAAGAENVDICGSPDSKNLKKKIYNDERFKSFIKAELPRLVTKGFL